MWLKIKRWRWIVLLSLVFFVFSFPYSGYSDTEPTAHLFIDPAQSYAATCETQTIEVWVENVTDLTAYHLEISFDPAVVEVLEVVNGDFLAEPEDADYFYEPSNSIDNTIGLITFGMAQQGVEVNPDVEPQSGSGSLIVITFRALVANLSTTFSIHPLYTELVEWPDVQMIPFTASDGLVETMGCYTYYFPLFTR